MKGEQPVCSQCGYPVHSSEHAPDCPTRKESTEQQDGFVPGAAAIEALGVDVAESSELTVENFKEKFETAMLEAVHGLPEELAQKLGTVDVVALNSRAQELVKDLGSETDSVKRSELQVELIFQYITMISRVQGPGDKAITPALARELTEMDCSLGTWSLKEKLQGSGVDDINFEFGYPAGHAVGMVTVADGKVLYVDAQNGIVAEVQLEKVTDEDQPDTAYPIFQIKSFTRRSGEIPNEGEVLMGRPDGSDYIPDYLGIRPDGTLHALGNMHMFINPESPIFDSKTGVKFREKLKNDPDEWERFQEMVNRIAGGAVIQETKFYSGD